MFILYDHDFRTRQPSDMVSSGLPMVQGHRVKILFGEKPQQIPGDDSIFGGSPHPLCELSEALAAKGQENEPETLFRGHY